MKVYMYMKYLAWFSKVSGVGWSRLHSNMHALRPARPITGSYLICFLTRLCEIYGTLQSTKSISLAKTLPSLSPRNNIIRTQPPTQKQNNPPPTKRINKTSARQIPQILPKAPSSQATKLDNRRPEKPSQPTPIHQGRNEIAASDTAVEDLRRYLHHQKLLHDSAQPCRTLDSRIARHATAQNRGASGDPIPGVER